MTIKSQKQSIIYSTNTQPNIALKFLLRGRTRCREAKILRFQSRKVICTFYSMFRITEGKFALFTYFQLWRNMKQCPFKEKTVFIF